MRWQVTKAASVYETGHAGIYEMCKEDYPYIESELRKEQYQEGLKIEKLKRAKIFRMHLVARKVCK